MTDGEAHSEKQEDDHHKCNAVEITRVWNGHVDNQRLKQIKGLGNGKTGNENGRGILLFLGTSARKAAK